MPVSVELRWEDSVTLGEIAQFVAHARSGGIEDGDPLEMTVSEDDHHHQDGWRVELAGAGQPMEADVRLPVALVRSTLELLNLVAESDGDVRGLHEGVVKTRDELLQALLGG